MLQRQLAFTLCIYTILATLFCISPHVQGYSHAPIQTLPAYTVASVASIGLLNSSICRKELQNFREAVDQGILWSLKILDSSGGFKSGFLYGNNYWLGSRSQCFDTINTSRLQISKRKMLNNTLYRDLQKEFSPFEVNYFVANFRHNSSLQYHVNMFDEDIITLGLCLPASCTISDLNIILEKIFRDRTFLFGDLYSVDLRVIEIKDLKHDNEWLFNSAFPYVCIALVFSLFMSTMGTIYDIFVHQRCIKKNTMNKTNNSVENILERMKMKINSSSCQQRKIGKIIICFSAYTNTKKIFSTELNADAIPAIHGLRFLSMCCVIMIHTGYFTLDFMENKEWMWRCSENFYISCIFNIGTLSIDTYFFLSGCLMAYLYLKNKINKGPIKPIGCREKLIDFFIHIIKRVIRLAPAYMMVLGMLQMSSTWFNKTSQFYMYEKSHETCAKYWWRNLLFINNLFSHDTMCMSWGWYLANDMQYYVIAMTLLILSTVYFYTAVTTLGSLLIGSIIFSGYVSYINEYIPTWDEQHRLANILYYSPWVRISPYIIGIIAGYILRKVNNNLVLKKKIIVLYWCLASACIVFVLFGPYKLSVTDTAIYIAMHRTLWAIGIAWVVIACSTKYGGVVNQLLSFKGWIPFSKLTYCAYLLNPLIIQSIHSYSDTSIHYEFLPTVVTSVGYIAITYFCSFALSLMVEIPCILLMRMFIQYRNTKKNT